MLFYAFKSDKERGGNDYKLGMEDLTVGYIMTNWTIRIDLEVPDTAVD